MKDQLLWIICLVRFISSKIEVDQWKKSGEVNNIQLSPCIIVILSVTEINHILQNSFFEIRCVIQFWIKL